MSRRDELIEKYAADLREKIGVTPNMELLKQVTIGCGPAIYNADAATVSSSDPDELKTVKEGFLMKKLGLSDGLDLEDAIEQVMQAFNDKADKFVLIPLAKGYVAVLPEGPRRGVNRARPKR